MRSTASSMSSPRRAAMARSAPRSAITSLRMRFRKKPRTDMTHKTELPETDHISEKLSRRASSKLPSVGLVIGALLLGTAASAQTIAAKTGIESEKVDSQAAPPPSGLTGGWGGMGTSLPEAGIDSAASYGFETAYNP